MRGGMNMSIKISNNDFGFGASDAPSRFIIERLDPEKIHDNLRCDINTLLKQLSPNCPQYDSNDSLSHVLSDKRKIIALIVFDMEAKKIVGIASALFRFMLSNVSVAIGDVVIDEKHCGKGLGKALIKSLIKRIKEKNDLMIGVQKATHISLTSHPSREVANKLYQELGFEKRDTNLYRLSL